MEFQSFNKELIYANLQFKRIFNNISIEEKGKKINFTCLLGNRSRVLKGLENPNRDAMYKLPMIIIQRTGITKNNDRLSNINNEVKYKVYPNKLDYNLYTPVPIDISYQVSIVSKYQKHIDWVVSNFVPFFNKDIFVNCEHPKFKGLNFTNQIVMEDVIEEEHNDEIDSSTDDLITCTCNFTYKTYLFNGSRQSDVDYQVIQKVSVYLSTDEEGNQTEISDVVDTIYEGFIPVATSIKYGFYPTPLLSSHEAYMEVVDAIPDDKLMISSYISTDLSGYDHYGEVTTSAEYYPYVDRMCWKIDEGNISWSD